MAETHLEATGVGFDTPNGGRIGIPPGSKVRVPTNGSISGRGVALGPLHLSTISGSTALVENLQYDPEIDSSSTGLFTGAGFVFPAAYVGASNREDESEPSGSLTRRDLLALLAVGLTLGTRGVSAASDTFPVARFDLATNPNGVEVLPIRSDESILSADSFSLFSNGGSTHLQSFDLDSGTAVIPSGETGTFVLATQPSVGFRADVFVDKILGWEPTLSYSFSLPDTAAKLPVSEPVTLSTHPMVVDPVRQAGGDDTFLTIGGTSIPHTSESDIDEGTYHISDGALQYTPSDEAPSATNILLQTRVDTLDELDDDLSRR